MMIRMLRPGEEAECNAFHNRYYGHRRTLAQWQWEFLPNSVRFPQIPFAVADDRGRIVGTQAFIPVRMIDRQGVYWTAKSEETLVDPEYRGQDLSVQMYRLLFDFAEENELACVWGFTTATKALQRSGFTVPADTSQLFFPFSTRCVPVLLEREENMYGNRRSVALVTRSAGKLACVLAQIASSCRFAASGARRRAGPESGPWEIRPLREAPPDGGVLCAKFVERWGGSTILRDQDYLQWRVFRNPWVKSVFRGAFANGELQGWVVFALGDDGMGYVVDLMVAGPDETDGSTENLIRILLTDATIRTRDMGAVGIRAWRVTDHPFDCLVTRVAKSMGFYHLRRGASMVLYPTTRGRQHRDLDRLDNWYVTRLYTEGLLG